MYVTKMTQSHGLYRRTFLLPAGTAHLSLPWSSRSKSLCPRPAESQRQSQLDWPALGLTQEVVKDVKNLWSFPAEPEALLVLGMCLVWSQVVPSTEAALLGALDPPEPARAFLLDASAPVSAPGCEHVGVCATELTQPFLHKERPRSLEPSPDGPHPRPPLFLFASHSSLSTWGGRRRTRCRRPVPRGWHASLPPPPPWRPPKSLTSTAAQSQAASDLATLPCTRLPRGAPQHTHFLPAVCMRRARSHLLAPKLHLTDMSPSHTGPPASRPPGRRLIGRK